MNLRKRLLVSNVVMVAVPVAVELLVLAGAARLFWTYLTDVRGIGAAEQGDVLQAGSVLSYLGSLYGDDVLKAAAVACALGLAALLAASVALTNRFCSRFLLAKVAEPLEELSRAASEVGAGNLAYRLPEGREDEFGPVFSEFNAMAAGLAAAAERERAEAERLRAVVSGLGHDLRTPLTSIRSYAEGVLDGVAATPEASERYLRVIVAKAQAMQGLTNRLLDAARLGADVDFAALPVVDLADVVAAWLGRADADLRAAGVDAELARVGRPPLVRADPTLVGRVLDNLAANCAKYACGADGRCRLRLELAACPEGLRLTAADDGPGVPAEALEHLFDLFFRADAARTRPADGSGVGLAVVADVARQLHGSVRAELPAGGGLAIVMTLPAATGEPTHA